MCFLSLGAGPELATWSLSTVIQDRKGFTSLIVTAVVSYPFVVFPQPLVWVLSFICMTTHLVGTAITILQMKKLAQRGQASGSGSHSWEEVEAVLVAVLRLQGLDSEEPEPRLPGPAHHLPQVSVSCGRRKRRNELEA